MSGVLNLMKDDVERGFEGETMGGFNELCLLVVCNDTRMEKIRGFVKRFIEEERLHGGEILSIDRFVTPMKRLVTDVLQLDENKISSKGRLAMWTVFVLQLTKDLVGDHNKLMVVTANNLIIEGMTEKREDRSLLIPGIIIGLTIGWMMFS